MDLNIELALRKRLEALAVSLLTNHGEHQDALSSWETRKNQLLDGYLRGHTATDALRVLNMHDEVEGRDHEHNLWRIDRRGLFGNPFPIGSLEPAVQSMGYPNGGGPRFFPANRKMTRDHVILKFEFLMLDRLLGRVPWGDGGLMSAQEMAQSSRTRLRKLKGGVLGCFCSPAPCHGHVYARLLHFVDSVLEPQARPKPLVVGSRR